MSISEQRVRIKGGRCSARGARTRIQVSNTTDRLIEDMERPKQKPRPPRKPRKEEVDHLIAQAHEAVVNHPDSVSAVKRYDALLAYKKENF